MLECILSNTKKQKQHTLATSATPFHYTGDAGDYATHSCDSSYLANIKNLPKLVGNPSPCLLHDVGGCCVEKLYPAHCALTSIPLITPPTEQPNAGSGDPTTQTLQVRTDRLSIAIRLKFKSMQAILGGGEGRGRRLLPICFAVLDCKQANLSRI